MELFDCRFIEHWNSKFRVLTVVSLTKQVRDAACITAVIGTGLRGGRFDAW